MLLIFYATVKKLTTLLLCPRITEEQSAAKLCFNYLCLRVEELKEGEDFFASPCLCRSTFSKERAIWSYMAGQRAALRTSRHQCVRVLCHGSVIWNVICINLFANSNVIEWLSSTDKYAGYTSAFISVPLSSSIRERQGKSQRRLYQINLIFFSAKTLQRNGVIAVCRLPFDSSTWA